MEQMNNSVQREENRTFTDDCDPKGTRDWERRRFFCRHCCEEEKEEKSEEREGERIL